MKKSTSIKIYLITLLLIFLTSGISMILLLHYMDPESNLKVALATMGVAAFLTFSALLTLIIYFFKKIYFRGEIFMTHLNASLRQGIFITGYALGIIVFIGMGVYNIRTAALLLIALLFIELIFQTITD